MLPTMYDYCFYKKYLNLIGFKSFKEFYQRLENAVINNLGTSSIKVGHESSLENDTTYYDCYNITELDTIYETYANILNHLEKNLFNHLFQICFQKATL
jgi:uncharacterized membrane protein